jgi:hypothetical protein
MSKYFSFVESCVIMFFFSLLNKLSYYVSGRTKLAVSLLEKVSNLTMDREMIFVPF